MNKTFIFALVAIFLAQTACIHVAPTEHKTLSLKPRTDLIEVSGPSHLKIQSLIYTGSIYPLETFVKKLLDGEFNSAMTQVDFNYKPSNVDNQIIAELIADGLVPVFVKIENKGTDGVHIRSENFFVSDGTTEAKALSHSETPRAFTRINSKAIAANAYNIGTAAIAYLGALVAIGVVTSQSGSAPYATGVASPTMGGSSSGDDTDPRILNPVNKTTVIDYQHYLIGDQNVMPNSSNEGLLFFRFKNKNGPLKLVFKD